MIYLSIFNLQFSITLNFLPKNLAERKKKCTFAPDLCRRGQKKRVTRWLRPAVKPVIN